MIRGFQVAAVSALLVVSAVTAAGCGQDGAPAPAAAAPSPSASTVPPVLGPAGLGTLMLGMTKDQADATGVAGNFGSFPYGACTLKSWIRKPQGGSVLISENLGVAVIGVPAGIRTVEGIGLGSTRADVVKAYPGLHKDGQYEVTPVPGNPKAEYKIIMMSDDKVVELSLMLANQDCYPA
ncbi:hypothetical protein F4553_000370 [Allocatelliglobosispora scoriae]|uniref:Lipoprotein n=1 Tax=Allocatelliglobosispora scoriae TaxID=643052 RepID=A0A841BJB7_9ACTN|nr:hypothetical protein [Allocatelliglobosispora scoriae]MBB5866991.1 hypothetical protein [Allocatelliglobosispora scoriae]